MKDSLTLMFEVVSYEFLSWIWLVWVFSSIIIFVSEKRGQNAGPYQAYNQKIKN